MFTKSNLISAGTTLIVVMIGLYVHDKFVVKMIKK
jgi:hypothetical protein